ncbi:hypothetical protein EVAR_37167_1 [Eumeta japonica]|uniref:Uncharacterized protein n=1 Tax=Eumeta variegata TaxID=151549 RepID=A0A4C1WJI9_EUMVA|nr:hypothetical protein EVAR_37167_1 [Eumeta japonica]
MLLSQGYRLTSHLVSLAKSDRAARFITRSRRGTSRRSWISFFTPVATTRTKMKIPVVISDVESNVRSHRRPGVNRPASRAPAAAVGNWWRANSAAIVVLIQLYRPG